MGANCMKLDFTNGWPNQSPEPTPIGHLSSTVAVHVVNTAWFSFGR